MRPSKKILKSKMIVLDRSLGQLFRSTGTILIEPIILVYMYILFKGLRLTAGRRPKGGYVGPMFAPLAPISALCCPYVSPMLALCSPMLALCWPKLALGWPKLALC